MRSFPNMTVVAPADGYETANAVRASVDLPGPVYIRIGRGFEQTVHAGEDYGFAIGRAVTMRDGSDLTVIACGPCVLHAVEAARTLADRQGIGVRVLNMHTVKPLDRQAVLAAATETRRIITAENHSLIGGLGSAVAEVIAESGIPCRLVRLGVPDVFATVGYTDDLYHLYKIDAAGIEEAAAQLLGVKVESQDDRGDGV